MKPAGATVREFAILNRQRARRVSVKALESLVTEFLGAFSEDWSFAVHLVSAAEMARVNVRYLGHEGSTDVITFDYGSTPGRLRGELYVSVPDALAQASEFGRPWTEELLRYVIHGLLHLAGYDDLEPAKRRRMKSAEGRWVRRFQGRDRAIDPRRRPRGDARRLS